MADGEEGESPPGEAEPGPSPQVIAESRQAGGAAPPKEPGWYPVRTNPNEQTYWDGTDWTRRRRWSAGTGWTEAGPDAMATSAAQTASVAGPRLSANPYAPRPTSTATVARPAPGVTLGILFLICSGVAMMVGSVTTWISSNASFGGSLFGGIAGSGHTVSNAVSGVTDGMSSFLGINGYFTLIAGAVILVFGGLMAVSDDLSVRIVGLLFSLAGLGVSIFAVVRLSQKLSATHTARGVTLSVGWGVILTLGAAALATLITLFEVTRNR